MAVVDDATLIARDACALAFVWETIARWGAWYVADQVRLDLWRVR
jgi:hypothetical protein